MHAATFLLLVLKTSIALTVLSLGLHTTWQAALYLFGKPRLLLRSLVSMNMIMPLVAAGLVVAFDLPTPVKVALVALAVSPVPPILPKKELKAGGHASYAVGLLVAIGVFAIVTVPIAVSWFSSVFDRAGEVPPLVVAKIVLKSVLAPLALGIALRQWAPALAERVARPIGLIGTVLLVGSALPLAYASWPGIRQLVGDGNVLIIGTMAVIGLSVGHLLGGPVDDDRTVLALSTTSRHPAIALTAAVATGEETNVEIAAILLYVIVALLVSIPYVVWRRRQSASRFPAGTRG
jgi:BASS family bile acid:Na+ symporter